MPCLEFLLFDRLKTWHPSGVENGLQRLGIWWPDGLPSGTQLEHSGFGLGVFHLNTPPRCGK